MKYWDSDFYSPFAGVKSRFGCRRLFHNFDIILNQDLKVFLYFESLLALYNVKKKDFFVVFDPYLPARTLDEMKGVQKTLFLHQS